ncbi:MAG: carboxylating nicotinate-nucleotide diphosphorylase [Anaplasma sp.]
MFEEVIRSAWVEDLGSDGDITTNCIFSEEKIRFSVSSREKMVLAGIVAAEEIFSMYGQGISFVLLKSDGSDISPGTNIIEGHGPASKILSLERVLLNFLQRASAISSCTREFVLAVAGTKAQIRSTRKTSPGLREFDLYAVRVGGGWTYRRGLYDGVMIKDNHIASCGCVTKCVSRIREKLGNDVFITVECDNMEQVEESVENSVNLIMLDNMSVSDIRDSVRIVKSSARIEVSGGVNMGNVREIAHSGVDYISIGAITHSFSCKDIGLDVC